MSNWVEMLLQLAERGQAAVLVTVADVAGSAPREAGAKMVVTDEASFGTIGGGQLEHRAMATARILLLQSVAAASRLEDVPLGPELGQCCGGRAWILFERLDQDDRAWLARLSAFGRGPGWMATRIGERGKQVFPCLEEALKAGPAALPDEVGNDGDVRLLGRAAPIPLLLEEIRDRRTPLYLFGAGHVGRAIVRALAPLPFHVTWVDDRESAFPPDPPQEISMALVDPPRFAVDRAPADAYYLVMTHSHPLDQEICEAILRRGDAAYIGLIGSASKRARFAQRLKAMGISEAALEELHCPIGLPGVPGKDPAIIAAAVAADLLLRCGGEDAARTARRR